MEKEIGKKFLPIGTVVLLKGANKKVMILSYLIFPTGDSPDKKMYDYGACNFPEGVVDSKVGIGFNHEDIEEVVHLGLKDDEYNKVNELLVRYCDDLRKEFQKSVDIKKAELKKKEEEEKKTTDKKEEPKE